MPPTAIDFAAPLRRAGADKPLVIDGERSVVARVCTNTIDEFRTLVDPAGCDLSIYNNVVLWEHGNDVRGRVPIGRCGWIKYDKAQRAILAKTFFFEDEFSDTLFKMYQQEVLRSWSVFGPPVPGKCSPPTPEEVKKRPELADCCWVYRAWKLQEYSAVSVGGNAEALSLAVSRGLAVPDSIRRALGGPGAAGKGPGVAALTPPAAGPAETPPAEPPPVLGRSRPFGEVLASAERRIAAIPIEDRIRRGGADLLAYLSGKV